MENKQLLYQLQMEGIVPVVKLNDSKHAVALAKALSKGGIHCAEITFRTDAAEESIRLIAKELPDFLVGAGTVLSAEKADIAIKAGAKFIVTPGLNPEVVKHCLTNNYPIVPGCSSPSDIEQALSLGLTHSKFFPAEVAGGINALKAFQGPYASICFMPTGGVNEANMNTYLGLKNVFCCGGTWMVKDELIQQERFDEITELSRRAVQHMHNYRIDHMGIACDNENEANENASYLANMFHLDTKDAGPGIFAGSLVEFMKTKNDAIYGHLAVACNNVERAMYQLKLLGYTFNEESARYDNNGHCFLIYLNETINHFAIHLIENKE